MVLGGGAQSTMCTNGADADTDEADEADDVDDAYDVVEELTEAGRG